MIPKFRAWDKNNAYMEYTEKNLTVVFARDGIQVVDHTTFSSSCTNMEDYVLMQSTGLKDKNGVEIYIGDILEWEMVMGHGWYENGKDVVIYDEKELRIKMSKRNNDTLNRVVAIGCEVVGNIYEHPHLLEEE